MHSNVGNQKKLYCCVECAHTLKWCIAHDIKGALADVWLECQYLFYGANLKNSSLLHKIIMLDLTCVDDGDGDYVLLWMALIDSLHQRVW